MKKVYKNERADKLDDPTYEEEVLYAHFIQSENIQKVFENVGAAMYDAIKELGGEIRDLKQTQQKASSKSKTTRAWWKIWK